MPLGDVRLYTIRPTVAGPDALRAARRAWTRASAAPAGVWTVEQSPDGPALHLHALAPAGALPALRGVHLYQSAPLASIRGAAAYISKPSSAPDPAIYDGRTWGTYGPLAGWLLGGDMPAHIQGAAIESMLNRADRAGSGTDTRTGHTAPTTTDVQIERSGQAPTDADYREIARAHLPRLHDLAGRPSR